MVDYDRLVSESLSGDCDLAAFRCGEGDIDRWLLKVAPAKHEKFKSRVTSFRHEGERSLLGFYSLKMVLEAEADLRAEYNVRDFAQKGVFPALHLEYLGVCENHQDQGLGRYMMTEVLDHFCHMAECAAVEILTLQPLNPKVADFYARRKFRKFGKRGAMLLDARTAIKARDEALAGFNR